MKRTLFLFCITLLFQVLRSGISLHCMHMCLQQPRLGALGETDCAKVLTVVCIL